MKTMPLKINRKQSVYPNEVLMLKANINYTELHLQCGRKIMIAKTLKEFYKEFEKFGFFMVNRSVVINMKFLTKTNENFKSLNLINKFQLRVSRRRINDFKAILEIQKKPIYE